MSDFNRTQVLSADPNRTQLGMPPVAFDPNRTVMGTAPTLEATQTVKPVQCTVCRTFNPTGVLYCVDCGLLFAKALPADAFGAPRVELPRLMGSDGKEHFLRPGPNVVGREGDVLVADSGASRKHAKVTLTDGVVTVEDLGSANGTKVDGARLTAGESRTLVGGEKLSFGGAELQLLKPGEASSNATQAFASGKTQAISAAPKKDVAPARLTGSGLDFPLRAGVNTFGRRESNDVRITDPYVSGAHGSIEVSEAGIFLTDVGSSNGTVLNGAKLNPSVRTLMGPNDVLRLGALELKVVRTDPA